MRITIFEIIHKGYQDTFIFHIQSKKIGVNGENFSMLFLSGTNTLTGASL